ncbi:MULTISPECIES: sugar ABC transporter permease [unclassified Rathayibacter]|uniref:carbohydrate ABC transporter permease n=1 Tax=unclassified Rathayibacter TaxID=2609250 RepID=UPI001052C5BA|nr:MULTISPECIES: sugar ABC transporter permease [unclassified Rathayibacter]TCL79460.1 alpha-glucoside transport system permease protein [Rathayibacter sp. PhB192]TCM25271.1 alpha-glucoside transport system permease protein [Rathayibacter sp. PhB179]
MIDLSTSVPALILIGAIAIPAAVYLLLGLGERILERLLPRRPRSVLRPWVWLLVPLLVVALILLYPLLYTVVLSVMDETGTRFVGGENFVWAFSGSMLEILGNNVIWIVAFPVGTLVLALIVAVVFDRVRYEKLAMTLIVLPTAISFAAGSIIWRQNYSYQPAGSEQRGLLNALWTLLPGAAPIPWLQTQTVNTFALIFVAIWSGLGVAALILSAAVKNVPADMLEAARLDGAGEFRVFFSMVLPSIAPAVLVVITTEVIFALKVFDIVYVMTNGNFGTDVVANRMYSELFSSSDYGHASAIAILLLIAAAPIIALNIRQFRAEKEA